MNPSPVDPYRNAGQCERQGTPGSFLPGNLALQLFPAHPRDFLSGTHEPARHHFPSPTNLEPEPPLHPSSCIDALRSEGDHYPPPTRPPFTGTRCEARDTA